MPAKTGWRAGRRSVLLNRVAGMWLELARHFLKIGSHGGLSMHMQSYPTRVW